MAEAVNHPAHYGGVEDPYETIKVLRARLTTRDYCGARKFQVTKSIDRHIAIFDTFYLSLPAICAISCITVTSAKEGR